MTYALAVFAIVAFLFTGSKKRDSRLTGWGIGFISQGLWFYYGWTSNQDGLLVLSIFYAGVYGFNFYRTLKGKDR